jgi:hypothetical protein
MFTAKRDVHPTVSEQNKVHTSCSHRGKRIAGAHLGGLLLVEHFPQQLLVLNHVVLRSGGGGLTPTGLIFFLRPGVEVGLVHQRCHLKSSTLALERRSCSMVLNCWFERLLGEGLTTACFQWFWTLNGLTAEHSHTGPGDQHCQITQQIDPIETWKQLVIIT